MNRLAYLFIFLFIVSSSLIFSQTIPRVAEITDPAGLEEGGFGNGIAGVDWDQDGLPEIYACNTNMVDRTNELVPKIYKFEWNPVTSEWDSVWGVVAPVTLIDLQNTWPAFAYGDVDKDGKSEIFWGPVNFLPDNTFPNINPNPLRVIVYEYPDDGSDNMGVSDGLGGFLPNASTSIVNSDNFELRPLRFIIADPDNDGTEELIFADRIGVTDTSDVAWHVGILSVSDIPDFGSGTETWTVEFSGMSDVNLDSTGAKYDVAVLNNFVYVFDANLTGGSKVWPVRYSSGSW